MGLNLSKGARLDEHFHLQVGPPVAHVIKYWFYKRVIWSNLFLADGTPGFFTSWWVIGNMIHWYKGNVKCDGTRTQMYWNGQLDDDIVLCYVPDNTKYVMTTTQKEKFSVRLFVDPGEPVWNNMGGS